MAKEGIWDGTKLGEKEMENRRKSLQQLFEGKQKVKKQTKSIFPGSGLRDGWRKWALRT